MGLVLLVLAMGVQMMAAISPARASNTESGNDIIPNGFDTKQEAVNWCTTNLEIRTIFAHFGVSCTAVAGSEIVPSISTRAYDNQMYSLGRNPYGKPGETPVKIGAQTFYMRPVSTWGTFNFKALRGVRDSGSGKGKPFLIMFDCGNIIIIGPPTAPIPPPPPPPPPVLPKEISCSNLSMSVANGSRIKIGSPVAVSGQAVGKNFATSSPHVSMQYDFVNATTNKVIATKKTAKVNFSGSTANDPNSYQFSSDTAGDYLIKLTVRYDSTKVAAGSAAGNCLKRVTVERPCEDARTSDDLELCLAFNKSATNLTQKIANANGTTAQASDDIQYTLSVKNTGKVTVPKFTVKENMNDVLEYANITNMHGGELDKKNYLSWPPVDIKPGQTIQKKITVRVKNPIPSTPVSTSDPESFNLIMTNVYGDTVNINLPGSVPKQVELTTTLPNTGPGEALAAGFALTVVVAYFYARSRLFATELDIVKHEFSSGGA